MSGDNNSGEMYAIIIYMAREHGEPAYITFAHNLDGSLKVFTELEPAQNYQIQIHNSQIVKFVNMGE